jgi:DNA-binding NarL/FixJ family response regulator
MKRILIADDNVFARRGLKLLIERQREWKVVGEAMDGRDAIERVRELHPDLVVLDLAMPNMNGFQAAQELTKLEPDLPILLCTVLFSSYVVDQARKSGIQGAVPKSEGAQITEAINALIQHQTFFSDAARAG